MKKLVVNKINYKQLVKLQNLGYTVIIKQATVTRCAAKWRLL